MTGEQKAHTKRIIAGITEFFITLIMNSLKPFPIKETS